MAEDKPTVLVVEDNPDNRTLIADVLDMMDFHIIEAVDGNEGVSKAHEAKPQLILMDLSLPHKDGWTATRELKANPKTKAIPIVALTAHAMVGDRERAIEAGCDDYITKPVDFIELKRVINKYLGASD